MRAGGAAVPPSSSGVRSVGASGYLVIGGAALTVAGNAIIGAPCGLRLATGHFCALCGGTRAARALVHGDVFEAMRMNFVVTMATFLFVLLATAFAYGPARGAIDRSLARILDLRASRIALAIATWTILRNLPGLEVLRPPT